MVPSAVFPNIIVLCLGFLVCRTLAPPNDVPPCYVLISENHSATITMFKKNIWSGTRLEKTWRDMSHTQANGTSSGMDVRVWLTGLLPS